MEKEKDTEITHMSDDASISRMHKYKTLTELTRIYPISYTVLRSLLKGADKNGLDKIVMRISRRTWIVDLELFDQWLQSFKRK